MIYPFSTCPYISSFVSHVGRWEPNEQRLHELHTVPRKNYALVYVENATIQYKSNGIDFVVNPGEIVLIPKGLCYENHFLTKGSCIAINFLVSNSDAYQPPFCKIKLCHPRETYELFLRFIREYTFKSPGYEARLLKLFYSIIQRIEQDSEFNRKSYRQRQKIAPSVAYIEEHFRNPQLNLDQIAELSGMSKVWFRKNFTEAYQISPLQYVINLRITEAKSLLTGTDHSMADIAEKSGFSDMFYFSKMFHRKTGMTPGEYRAKRNDSADFQNI
ncbi:MAG: helix-turn-helix transcriptional regulator [Ruminococcaceae bacterium]|nr:helix-turn-helix transcriptional regulator [Oscillospiraceae bacterium]